MILWYVLKVYFVYSHHVGCQIIRIILVIYMVHVGSTRSAERSDRIDAVSQKTKSWDPLAPLDVLGLRAVDSYNGYGLPNVMFVGL